MTPEDIEAGKVIAGWLATIVAAAVTAWRVRGRRESRVPIYSGHPDETSRKITRKEWHDMANRVHSHGGAIANLTNDYTRLRKEVDTLSEHPLWEGFARLEERFESHVANWERAGERAEQDRRDIITRLDSLDRKLDQRSA